MIFPSGHVKFPTLVKLDISGEYTLPLTLTVNISELFSWSTDIVTSKILLTKSKSPGDTEKLKVVC